MKRERYYREYERVTDRAMSMSPGKAQMRMHRIAFNWWWMAAHVRENHERRAQA